MQTSDSGSKISARATVEQRQQLLADLQRQAAISATKATCLQRRI
jgi:hypothetical protein